jgi:hypothetical protein
LPTLRIRPLVSLVMVYPEAPLEAFQASVTLLVVTAVARKSPGVLGAVELGLLKLPIAGKESIATTMASATALTQWAGLEVLTRGRRPIESGSSRLRFNFIWIFSFLRKFIGSSSFFGKRLAPIRNLSGPEIEHLIGYLIEQAAPRHAHAQAA